MTLERVLPWLDDMLDAIDWIGRLMAGRSLVGSITTSRPPSAPVSCSLALSNSMP